LRSVVSCLVGSALSPVVLGRMCCTGCLTCARTNNSTPFRTHKSFVASRPWKSRARVRSTSWCPPKSLSMYRCLLRLRDECSLIARINLNLLAGRILFAGYDDASLVGCVVCNCGCPVRRCLALQPVRTIALTGNAVFAVGGTRSATTRRCTARCRIMRTRSAAWVCTRLARLSARAAGTRFSGYTDSTDSALCSARRPAQTAGPMQQQYSAAPC
jgi:hypothetical protein